MANILRNWLDNFLGSGDAAVTVPPLDGALKPNNRLEEAPRGITVPQPDCCVTTPAGLIYSSGNTLFLMPFDGSAGREFHRAASEVTALAVSSAGILALAIAGKIQFLDLSGAPMSGLSGGQQNWTTVTALAFAPDDTLVIAVGSSKNLPADWQRDLLERERAGLVWRLVPSTGKATQFAQRLRYPNGLAVAPDGTIIVSEAWEKQLIRLAPNGTLIGQVIEDLPGYPARISPSGRGGYWLSVFAPRSQLIEFVLREPAYRKAMMAEVDKEFWVAPALRSGYSFREPMQGGALKQMGILKPWAPTRSYGLVVELTGDFVPARSFHSRTGGRRHGITSAVEADGKLWMTSKGGDEVFAIDLGGN
ncbi:WD40 repeat protein [Rhizobium aquaticum]|uniref:WD40 repeat protein n=1 Tax=Rhizobium aquaticum TaxID=1549636 RepID=A0ABV2J5V3_9HYPH